MSHHSEGIQLLLNAEKRATQKIQEAREKRVRKVKQAREEAQQEIQKLRQIREAELKRKESQNTDSISGAKANIAQNTQKEIDKYQKGISQYKQEVIDFLLKLCLDVKVDLHRNYRGCCLECGNCT